MKLSRWVFLLAFGIVLVVVFWLVRSRGGALVTVVGVERASIRAYVEERAKTRLPDIYEITMPLNGRIRPIQLREGDLVQKGQIVAEMDVSDLDEDLLRLSKQVEVSRNELQNYDRSLAKSEQTLVASKARLDYAEQQSKRNRMLAKTGAASETDLEIAELRLVEATVKYRKDVLDDANLRTDRANAEVRFEELVSRQREAQRNRDRAVVPSPVTGVVLRRQSSNERWLPAGTTLLEIGSLGQLEVEAEVLTQDAVAIREGQLVEIEGPAVGTGPVRGEVKRVFPQGFEKRSSLGVEQQRVIVLISFGPEELERLADTGRMLGADYRLRVKIFTAQSDDALVVPRSAVFRGVDGTWQVFRVVASRVQPTTIEAGLRNDFQVEVTSGLAEGDLVVIAPDSSLVSGQRVETRFQELAGDPAAITSVDLSTSED